MGGRTDSITNERAAIVIAIRFVVAALGGCVPLASSRLSSLDAAERLLVATAAWGTWALILLFVLVPSAVSLTGLRLLTPVHFTVFLLLTASNFDTGVFVSATLSAIVVVLALSAEIGQTFVQASAYGDEQRFLLRCPKAHVAVVVSIWTLWTASAFVGSLALVNRSWVFGGVLVALTMVGIALLPRRFHRYSRRWLVKVPAGLVVHDHVVLAETAMFDRRGVVSATIVAEAGDSADLSGGTGRPWLEIVLADFETVVKAATPSTPGGSAIHVKTFRVRPSRLTVATDAVTP